MEFFTLLFIWSFHLFCPLFWTFNAMQNLISHPSPLYPSTYSSVLCDYTSVTCCLVSVSPWRGSICRGVSCFGRICFCVFNYTSGYVFILEKARSKKFTLELEWKVVTFSYCYTHFSVPLLNEVICLYLEISQVAGAQFSLFPPQQITVQITHKIQIYLIITNSFAYEYFILLHFHYEYSHAECLYHPIMQQTMENICSMCFFLTI